MEQGGSKLCTPYGFKHIVEKFTDLFEKEHVYISTESATIALDEMGYLIEDGMVLGEWIYPDRETLLLGLGNSEFKQRFVNKQFLIPFYELPNMRVSAMVKAYSSAYERNGRNKFPMIDKFRYDELNWIDIENGALSYAVEDGYIVLDTIYAKNRQCGTGKKLFEKFLKEVSSYPDSYYIEIDAFTDDSIAFFEALPAKNNLFKPSRRLSKKNTYSIGVDELKKYKGITNGID